MSDRRMLSRSVIYQDALNDLPPVLFKLYVFLNLEADDDGIIGNPRMVASMADCAKDQILELVKLGYLLRFDNGMVAVVHWHVQNSIRKDRYKQSAYASVRKQLKVTEDDTYTVDGQGQPLDDWLGNGEPKASDPETQVKTSKDKKSKAKKRKAKTDKTSDDAKNSDASGQSGQILSDDVVSVSQSVHSDSDEYAEAVLNSYRRLCPSLTACVYLTEDIRKKVSQLGMPLEQVEEAFRMAESTPFLRGEGENGWKASLDWLCNGENLRRVRNGVYAPKKAPAKTSYGCGELGEAELEAIRKLMADDTLQGTGVVES